MLVQCTRKPLKMGTRNPPQIEKIKSLDSKVSFLVAPGARYLRVCRLDLTIPGRTGHSLARGSPSARRSRRFARNPFNKPSINDGDRPQLPRSTPAYPGEIGRGMFMFCNGWCAPPPKLAFGNPVTPAISKHCNILHQSPGQMIQT